MSDFVDASGRVQPGNNIESAVFVHEYTHYLHNISTLVGAEQTVAMLGALGFFANTLNVTKDGNSAGMAALSEAQRQGYPVLRRGFAHFLQATNHTWRRLPSTVKSLSFLGWHAEAMDQHDARLQRAVVRMRLSYDRAPDDERLLDLDTQVIEEGIAHLLESMYVEDHDVEGIAAPPFPYTLLYAIARHFVPCAFPIDAVRLALIALNTTNPGVWLLKNLSEPGFKRYMCRSRDLPQQLDWQLVFEPGKKNVVSKLRRVAETFQHRGLLSLGIDSAVDTTVRLLDRRQRDPFFDVPALADEDRVDWATFFSRTVDIEPCEFLVERGASDHQLFTFSTDSSERISGRRTLDLAVGALIAHLDVNGEFLQSTQTQRECRYYHCCQFPARKATPDTCRTTPWSYARSDAGEHRCWYGSGVLGLMAHINKPPPQKGP